MLLYRLIYLYSALNFFFFFNLILCNDAISPDSLVGQDNPDESDSWASKIILLKIKNFRSSNKLFSFSLCIKVSALLSQFSRSKKTAHDNFLILWLAGLYFRLTAWSRGFCFLLCLSRCPSLSPLALAVATLSAVPRQKCAHCTLVRHIRPSSLWVKNNKD